MALAVFERALRDMLREPMRPTRPPPPCEQRAFGDAVSWIEEADDSFVFWYDVAGVDWRRAQRALPARR